MPGAVELAEFPFRGQAERFLVWVARISPEKGLEDAVRAAQRAGFPLHVCGKIQDEDYWRQICSSAPSGSILYHGMLPHGHLSQILGRATAMLVTPKWVEAFGLTVIEALACGTPVIAYDQGGPSEIIEHGKSGFLVKANDVEAMADAVAEVGRLSRVEARRRAEEYGVSSMADKVEEWVQSVVELALACGAAT
ncbi:MAG: glycosyltransferase [Acidobacteriia bacterium]|nr:glycosyltransferase [Terriglobia bacterium]